MVPISVSSQKFLLTAVSFALFYFLARLGYKLGGDFGFWLMYENFGPPKGLYPILFGYVMLFTGLLFAFFGVVTTFLTMHWLGRRLKVAVGKPTLLGFLLYLLTLLILVLNYNRTH